MSRRTATRPEVRVGGFWLSSIAPQGWGQLEHSTRTNGSWQASWTIPIVRTWRHPALVYGAKVEVFLGPICIWSGTLEEPNWDSASSSPWAPPATAKTRWRSMDRELVDEPERGHRRGHRSRGPVLDTHWRLRDHARRTVQ